MPQTVEASTPRGGRHLLFQWDAARPITNSSGRLPAGLDVRGAGGYFIIWPSRREDGAEWRWECPPGFFDIAEAPAWLYELIRAKPERKPNGGAGGFGFRTQGGGAREAAWARAALEGCAADVAAEAKGKRNATLNACAYRLGRMIARGWLDRSRSRIAPACRRPCQRTCSGGWRARRRGHDHERHRGRAQGAARGPEGQRRPTARKAAEDADEEPRPPAFTDEALALRFAEAARVGPSLRRRVGPVAALRRAALAVRRDAARVRSGAADLPPGGERVQQGAHRERDRQRQDGCRRRAPGESRPAPRGNDRCNGMPILGL